MLKALFPALVVSILSFALLVSPASGFITFEEALIDATCDPDDNNTYSTATELEYISSVVNAVCDSDPNDWYHFCGQGYIDWSGLLSVLAVNPGLNVRVYFDEGNGLSLVSNVGPEYNPDYGLYWLKMAIHNACFDAGFHHPLNGDFYIRITYLSGYPGEHPYIMLAGFSAMPEKPGPPTTSTTGYELPVGENRHATLTQTDFYDWYYWEHPAGEPVDGVIELSTMKIEPDEEAPDMWLKVFRHDGVELASARLDEGRRFADIDLEPLGLYPGRFSIYVGLAESTNDLIMYQLRNRATLGSADGCTPDSNQDPSDAVTLTQDALLSDSLCHPRDSADFYQYVTDKYFIGDIVIMPWDGRMLLYPEITRGPAHHPVEGMPVIHGVSYHRHPVNPGTFDIKVVDLFGASPVIPYEIAVVPSGAGPYRAPGHGDWQSAEDVLQYDVFANYWHDYWFELKPGVQDRYCFRVSTDPEQYLTGIMEIYGSKPDYEVRVGTLDAGAPVWGPAMTSEPNGRMALDFGYQILTEPGDYFLRVKLDPSVTTRRRFYITQTFSLEECGEDYPDVFFHPGTNLWSTPGNTMSGTLCPPEDIADYGSFIVDSTSEMGIAPGYRMTVKAGYPGMVFMLFDFTLNLLWEEQIDELGGTATLNLSTVVQEGNTYVLEVSTDSADERLMVWSASFNPPFAPMLLNMGMMEQPIVIEVHLGELLEEIMDESM